VYPRLRLFIDRSKSSPEFIKVIVLEKSKASSVAQALREMNIYLETIRTGWIYN
jgi:hypothetical protein